jgi:hypothetical protein
MTELIVALWWLFCRRVDRDAVDVYLLIRAVSLGRQIRALTHATLPAAVASLRIPTPVKSWGNC